MKNFKKQIYDFLEVVPEDKGWEKAFNYFMVVLILLNTFAVVIETLESVDKNYYEYLFAFEIFSVIIFTIDYVARMWVITLNQKFSHPILGRIKYFFTVHAIIDLASILPFYMYAIFPFDLRFLRLFRLFRFIRLIKLERYSNSLKMFVNVFKAKKTELLITLFIIFFVVILSSCFIYMFEHDAQPDKYTNIPSSMYWSVMTITSVGYGDIYPVTTLGQIFAVFVALLGLAIFAIPTGILASGFYEELHNKEQKQNQNSNCPHCGMEIKKDQETY